MDCDLLRGAAAVLEDLGFEGSQDSGIWVLDFPSGGQTGTLEIRALGRGGAGGWRLSHYLTAGDNVAYEVTEHQKFGRLMLSMGYVYWSLGIRK